MRSPSAALVAVTIALTVGFAWPATAGSVKSVDWSVVYANPDRSVVRISLEVRPSRRPRRAVLKETRSTIRITLLTFVSDLPATFDSVTDCVEIRLQRRVGTRRLFDRDRPRRDSGPSKGPPNVTGRRPCRRLKATSG